MRESISRSLDGYKLSTIGWETLGAEIANCINELPIGSINLKVDLDNLDLWTPNRLLLGRNNDCSPTEPVSITRRYDKFIESNIFVISSCDTYWLKIWFIVLCCCTTGMTNLKVMESYATSSIILGFKRFSSQVGYPKVLLPDPGS